MMAEWIFKNLAVSYAAVFVVADDESKVRCAIKNDHEFQNSGSSQVGIWNLVNLTADSWPTTPKTPLNQIWLDFINYHKSFTILKIK